MAEKTVTLVDPNGQEIAVGTAADVNNLVFGAGYKIKGNKSVDQALAVVSGGAADDVAPATTTTATENKPAK